MSNDPVISGIGTAVPAHHVHQNDAAEAAMNRCCETPRQTKLLPVLYRMTTVKTRGSVLLQPERSPIPSAPHPVDASGATWFFPETASSDSASGNGNGRQKKSFSPSTRQRMEQFLIHAPNLAIEASREAMEEADVDPTEITHLVAVTCTGFGSPGLEYEMIKGLGLSPDVTRTHIGFMGCHAALNALQVADAFARAQEDAKILLCCVELCTLHFQYGWHDQQVVANALFSDGAASVVITGAHAAHKEGHLRIRGTASSIIDDTYDEMSWHVGDHGFDMTLSPAVPDVIRRTLRPWTEAFLADHDLSVDDIASWAIHAGGPRIVTAAGEALDLPETDLLAARHILQTHGNMSSATVLFIMRELLQQQAKRPMVALAFGPGLIVEGALLY